MTASVQAGINEYWNMRGSTYDAQPGHGIRSEDEREAWLRFLGQVLPPAPATVLDVGTGTGFLALLAASVGYRVVGVDLAVGMLNEAAQKSAPMAPLDGPTWVIGDAANPPFPSASFDAIISRHVLWTLASPSEALANWRRLLRPGGTMVIVDGLWWADRSPDETASSEAMDGEVGRLWQRAYGPEAQGALPLMLAKTLDPILDLVKDAGFSDTEVLQLGEVEALERAATPEVERWWSRYAVVGTHAS